MKVSFICKAFSDIRFSTSMLEWLLCQFLGSSWLCRLLDYWTRYLIIINSSNNNSNNNPHTFQNFD